MGGGGREVVEGVLEAGLDGEGRVGVGGVGGAGGEDTAGHPGTLLLLPGGSTLKQTRNMSSF